jgi:hypothetical protein
MASQISRVKESGLANYITLVFKCQTISAYIIVSRIRRFGTYPVMLVLPHPAVCG